MLKRAYTTFFCSFCAIASITNFTTAGPVPTNAQDGMSRIYYTYKKGMGGGVAAVVVHPNTGKIIRQEVLGESPLFVNPHKIKVSECGNYLLATSQHEAVNNIFLADLRNKTHKFLSVPRNPDDIGTHGCLFFVGAEEQSAYTICGEKQKTIVHWNGKHQLYPEGRRIEYVSTTPDGAAWTSWQKDSGSGRRKGSRVVVIDIASGRTIADLHIPRAMPHLNLADMKEQGPNPEIIYPSVKTNTLLLSMDLYGGIAMADLDAAQKGRWQNLTYHNTDPTKKWGTAFPDRGILYPTKNNDFALIANAGKNGGAVWIDLRRRQIVQTLNTPAGLEAPVIVANGRFLAAPVPGKSKSRFFGELMEGRKPQSVLYTFEVINQQGEPRLRTFTHDLPTRAYRAAPVNAKANDIVLLTAGNKNANELITVRASTGSVLDRVSAVGNIKRIAY